VGEVEVDQVVLIHIPGVTLMAMEEGHMKQLHLPLHAASLLVSVKSLLQKK
jgi:hypothetical protein